MNKNLSKILMVLTAILMIIGVYFFGMTVSEGEDAIKEQVELQNSIIGPAISYAIYVIGFAALLAVVFALKNVISQPKALVGAGIAIAFFAVIYLIASGQASNEVFPSYKEFDVTPSISKNVGIGLISFYWIAAISIVGAIVGEIYSAIK